MARWVGACYNTRMSECYRRFNNGTYLLTCGKPKDHKGDHQEMDGKETWPAEAGWSDAYTGAPLKYDPYKEPPPPVYDTITLTPEMLAASEAKPGDTQTLEEAAKSAPKFWDGVRTRIFKENT